MRSLLNGSPASTVYQKGSTVIARDRRGKPIASGTEPADVIQDVFDNHLTTGREYQERVKIVGDLTLTKKIEPPSWTFVDLSEAMLRVGSNWGTDSHLIDYESTPQRQVTIYGGSLYGNKANVTTTIHGISTQAKAADASVNVKNAHHRVLYTQIWDFTGYGVRARDRRGLYQMVNVRTCDKSGFFLASSDMNFIRCYADGNTENGFLLDGAGHCQLINSISHDNGAQGFHLRGGSSYTNIRGGFTEFNGRRGVLIASDAGDGTRINNIQVINNNVDAVNLPGLEVIGGKGCRVIDCRFEQDTSQTDGDQTTGVTIGSGASDTHVVGAHFSGGTTTPIDDSGTDTILKRNIGYVTENGGTSTFSGDGTRTQFKIAHGLAAAPAQWNVTPQSSDAAGAHYVTADGTYLYVNFSSAPASGTDNVKLAWTAEV